MVFLTQHIFQTIHGRIQLGIKFPQEKVERPKINEQ
jgi:hypothetical protein